MVRRPTLSVNAVPINAPTAETYGVGEVENQPLILAIYTSGTEENRQEIPIDQLDNVFVLL